MATTLAHLSDFIVTIDMAMHTVVDRTNEVGNVIRTIDFGATGEVADVVNSWMFEQNSLDRKVWAPALNAYLLEQFAKR